MRRYLLVAATVLVSGCTTSPRVVPVASAPLPAAPAAPTLAGYGNLVVPARLADGSYVTPNRAVSAAGAVWHLRAGLNVAALSCRGPEEAALIAGYNGLLQRHRGEFDQAYRTLGDEHGGLAAFDGAMTTLYNYYALPPAQPGLCAAAQAVLADAALVAPGGMAAFAPAALARLDRPYTQVFAAQEAWLATRSSPATTLIASVAAPTAKPMLTRVAAAPAPKIAIDPAVAEPGPAVVTTTAPQIAIDPAVLRMP